VALEDAGFTVSDCAVLPILNLGYDQGSYSAGIIQVIARFVPGRQGVTEAEATAWAEDLVAQGSDAFFSINRYVFVAVKPERSGA
jgi:arsenite methyltransferase